MAKFKSRPDPRIIPTQFTAILGKQPYKHFGMRAKSGLKRTAFHDVIGHAKEFHIHRVIFTALKQLQPHSPLQASTAQAHSGWS